MNNKLPIGIFDSGIGGLSVVKEIIRVLPDENLIYLGDTARVPYGTRDAETINKFAKELTEFLIKQKVKALVVACNTMSAVSLGIIKKTAGGISVIDVISPTVEFVISQKGVRVLGVIGTRATVSSGAYQVQVARHKKHIKIVTSACPLFVPLIEEGLLSDKSTEIIAKKYLADINKSDSDVLILGCTHYPMLLPTIRKILRRRIKIIDSAFPTAEKLKNVLAENNLLNSDLKKPIRKFYVTDNPERSLEIANMFFNDKFPGKIEKIRI